MNKIYRIFLLLLLWSCQSTECSFNSGYLEKSLQNELALKIVEIEKDCQDLLISGEIFTNKIAYSINSSLLIKDSTYIVSDELLFDFSQDKKSGFLQLHDSLKVSIDFLADIPFKNENFRLFKTNTIDQYYAINLSYVFVTHYRYGIVGEFILGNENGEYFSTLQKGFIPNEKLVYSLFKKAELL